MTGDHAGRTIRARRVSLVVSTPDRRGAEVFAVDLAERLDGRSNWSAELVALDESTTAEPLANVRVLGGGRRSWRTWVELVRAVRRTDVLVANGGTTLLPVAIVSALTRTPFVYRNIGDPTVWGDVRFAGARLGWPTRRAARVVALYPRAGAELSRRYGLRDDRIDVIGNAASAQRFVPARDDQRADARADLGLNPDLTWVAYVGALSPEKQPGLAIEAVLSDARLGLIVVGDGPLRTTCERLAEQAPDRVRLLGRRSDIPHVLHAVEALVISSRTEGISGAAIEAGLCGLPVVTTDVGGMSDLVVDGVTGVIVADPTPERLAHALSQAIENRSNLGAAAERRCREHFEITAVAQRWEHVLDAACRKDPR